MEILKQFILSFIATMGFGVLFSSPKETLFYASFVGALGWTINFIFSVIFNSSISGTFIAALTIGIMGELLARLKKKPATLYITPGIIPLVPGAGMYYTMSALVENDFVLAVEKGSETFFIAAAIAIGIIVSTIFSQSISYIRQKD